MVHVDPYTPDESYYECVDCLHRTTGETAGSCPECGATMRNIAVPRE